MFLVGFFIHLVFLYSIFDIYFKSPIVKNVSSYEPDHEPVAERLVLFVVDGLRAESFFNHTVMEYLRSKAHYEAKWGISQTHVPTESRPGHVAIIAGFYEDPSAVAKGWKENPVDFDSVFNQSRYTWCWGAYDIIGIFTKQATNNHIYSMQYDQYNQSFSSNKNTTMYDAWVFKKTKDFLQKAKEDDSLKRKLHENKTIFFLHLLGTDTSGHMHKPGSQNFFTTIAHVDNGIKEIEKVFRDFYNDDGKTMFLMTSDHGMTDWGSHGAGDDHETETPYVLWGAGVNATILSPADDIEHLRQETVAFPSINRHDISQADLTPLISSALSIPVPVNSVGRLPIELLNMTLPNKAKALYSNSRQLASQYDKKRRDVKENILPFLHYPYKEFDEEKYEELIIYANDLLVQKEYESLMNLSYYIMDLSLNGLDYYHNYYQYPLLVLVTSAFIGWIFVLMRTLLEQYSLQTEKLNLRIKKTDLLSVINIVSMALFFNAMLLVIVQSLPLQYCLYFGLPVLLWWYAIRPPNVWPYYIKALWRQGQLKGIFTEIAAYTLGSLAMGLSFTSRWILSIPLLGMALWPYCLSPKNQISSKVLKLWTLSCILLSTFTFMPVVGKKVFIELVVFAGLIWMLFLILYNRKFVMPLYRTSAERKKEMLLNILHTVLLGLSLHNVYVQSQRFENGAPVNYVYQSLAWIISVISFALPLLHSKRMMSRIMAANTSVLTFYLLLSVSHEGLFLVTLMCSTLCWIYIEFKLITPKNAELSTPYFDENGDMNKTQSLTLERGVSRQDFRRAFFFLLYLVISFFGTGNIAALNSFEVRWVTCFTTSFHPFLITGLILLKTLAPFLCVACAFNGVQLVTKAPLGYLNVIVLIYSNIMGIQLLYYVRNTGSWLEIGTSISQYVIVQVITLFIVIIHQLAKVFTNVQLFSFVTFQGRKKIA